jgi:adenylate cyclase
MAFDAHGFLASQAVPEAQVAEAEAGGWLLLLVVDQLLFGGPARFTAREVAAAGLVEPELANRLWRAMGLTEIDDENLVSFYPQDVEALTTASEARRSGTPVDTIVRQTRVISSAVSRIAEASADEVVAAVRELRSAGRSDDDVAEWLRGALDIDRVEKLLGYFFRRQLRAALWRKLAVPPERVGEHDLTIAFVDLVRFTALTEEVAEEELDTLVTRFEELAHEQVTAGGGRMVKMIGDEVMFVADDPMQGTAIALDLVEAYAADERLPPARAGLSCGSVLPHGGDYFGPVVNLASRIVDVARPKAVVGSDVVHQLLRAEPGLSWRRLPPKRLKGIGYPPLWSVRRAPA